MTETPGPPASRRRWWRAREVMLPLALHVFYLAGLCQFQVSDAELARILGPSQTERPVAAVLQRAGVSGALGLYFGVHEQIQLYHRYAEAVWRGRDPRRDAKDPVQGTLVAYDDVEIEYQPGKLLLMVPPALFSSRYAVYLPCFIVWSGFLYIAAVVGAIHGTGDGSARQAARALWWSLSMLVLFGPYAAAHLDPAIALSCALAWLAFRRGFCSGHLAWYGLSGVLAAAGVLVKLAPAVVVVAAGIALLAVPVRPRWREALWLTLAFVAALLAFHTASLACWGDGYLASYAFHLDRGIQIESTWAGLLRAGSRWFGEPIPAAYSYGSYHLVTGLTPSLRPLFPIAWLGLAALVAVRARRRAGDAERVDPAEALPLLTVILLLGLVLSSGVFSFNYLLWLTPLMPAFVDRVRPWLPLGPIFATALALTQAQRIYDYAYAKIDPPTVALILLNLRNLTLIALLVALVFRLPRLLSRPPLAPQNAEGRAAA